MDYQPLFSESFLRSQWDEPYQQFRGSPAAAQLRQRLAQWAERHVLKERSAAGDFTSIFFKQIWGYQAPGEGVGETGYTAYAEYPVAAAGQTGGTGSADLALGYFGRADLPAVAQVLCEYKDIQSGLDRPQHRKGNTRSPVAQCLDYLKFECFRVPGNAPVQPAWAVVTDMNEFRLYSHQHWSTQFQRFVLRAPPGEAEPDELLAEGEDADFRRFVFSRLFRPDLLLSTGGPCGLRKLLDGQMVAEKELERAFYREYQAYRQAAYQALLAANPGYANRKRQLIRYTQRLLDRFIFILFVEDRGQTLNFPPNLLRDVLIKESADPDYAPEDCERCWALVKRLFAAMRDGTPFREHPINRFNGGLFADEPELDRLRVPARLFCARGQGAAPAHLGQYPNTLLYFSATYNFGIAQGGRGNAIGLTTLGRIFEQSITDLEIMAARAEGRQSLAELSKRKTDGVYYTPEVITRYIVEETVGARLAELRIECGLDAAKPVSAEDAAAWRAGQEEKRHATLPRRTPGPREHSGPRPDPRQAAPLHVVHYLQALDRYRNAVDRVTVLDPACGSGAFLVQALDRLLAERQFIAAENTRIRGQGEVFDSDEAIRLILSNNIYGVDVNPESVEITRLALWLHTARANTSLATLDEHLRCGNSLVASDFYAEDPQRELWPTDRKELVNTFDWDVGFHDVLARGGFDCIVGNPPYVKLQHFRTLQPEMAEYLMGRRVDGTVRYESTQTGNFDLYLPFIEKGLSLLHPQGRMGFIAPNVWLVNEYGKGLRRQVHRLGALDRWLDFKSYQVFEESITYTALQFYRGSLGTSVRCAFAPDGDLTDVSWRDAHDAVPYSELPPTAVWNLMPAAERRLIRRLQVACLALGSPKVTAQILQGLITSADSIYHLRRVAPGRYACLAGKPEKKEVPLEDGIMKPLVSGAEAKRYQEPRTGTYLLFPYYVTGDKPRLWTAAEMQSRFPQAWAYLKRHETTLRARERGAFDDDQWYRFGRNQSIDKQHLPKLMVPRLVRHLFCVCDTAGRYCLDNVDVGGVLVAEGSDQWFVAGLLNSPVLDFVWYRTSKPFQNNYRSANKQFLAPLPIPQVPAKEEAQVGRRAQQLQELHTRRRDLVADIDRRLTSAQCLADERAPAWLWAEVHDAAWWQQHCPDQTLAGRALTAWAKTRHEEALTARLEALDPLLPAEAELSVTFADGELRLLADGRPVIEGVFLDDTEGVFIAAQWRQVARTTHVTEAFDGKRLAKLLLGLRRTDNAALREQVVRLDAEVGALEGQIATAEREMDDLVYRLYRLTPEEIRLVEADRRR